jgi:hypothetical protein
VDKLVVDEMGDEMLTRHTSSARQPRPYMSIAFVGMAFLLDSNTSRGRYRMVPVNGVVVVIPEPDLACVRRASPKSHIWPTPSLLIRTLSFRRRLGI